MANLIEYFTEFLCMSIGITMGYYTVRFLWVKIIGELP